MFIDADQGGRSSCVDEANKLREYAAKLLALAVRLRKYGSVAAHDTEQMAHEWLARADAIERSRGDRVITD
jgi:hypothetical protein